MESFPVPAAAPRPPRLSLDELTALALGADPRRMEPARLYLGLKGRLPRRAYWVNGVLALLGLAVIANGLLAIARVSDDVAAWIVIGVFAWPFIALIAKRLHDFGVPGWWVPLGLVGLGLLLKLAFGFSFWWLLGNFVGLWFLGVVVAGLVPGTHGPNRFGPDPHAVNSGH